MIDLKNIGSIYFIGIGGIGMSGLARYFNDQGKQVLGYDKVSTEISRGLEELGIKIDHTEEVDWPQVDLVIYTPAIPATHKGLVHYRNTETPVIKRSDALERIAADYRTIAVAGTHGKTTISSMIAHLLKNSNVGCTAFVGGMMKNYDSNYIKGNSEWLVVEADEYDRSFLKLDPEVSVISSIDPDHLDVYGSEEELKKSFGEFGAKTNGLLVANKSVKNISGSGDTVSYGDDQTADNYYSSMHVEDGALVFDYNKNGETITGIRLNYPGRHNVENATAAITVARYTGVGAEDIRNALEAFEGIKRRFDVHLKTANLIYIDDYAHHPKEISTVLSAIRELYPGKKITTFFQPHLYSRTRDFAEGFASSLDLADKIYLIPIYPAREEPIEGVSSAVIVELMESTDVQVIPRDQIVDHLDEQGVIVTLGAGDIDLVVQPVLARLKSMIHEEQA